MFIAPVPQPIQPVNWVSYSVSAEYVTGITSANDAKVKWNVSNIPRNDLEDGFGVVRVNELPKQSASWIRGSIDTPELPYLDIDIID